MNSKVIITLVRPSYSAIYGVYGKVPKQREIRPPLGLMYIAAALEKEGYIVNIIDGEPDLLSIDDLEKKILDTNPQIVGFSSTTPEFYYVENIVKRIKNKHPKIVIIVGGAHVSAMPEETLKKCPEIDYIVKGEGEISVVKIVRELPIEKIIESPMIDDLDNNVLPARHLVDYKYYNYAIPGKGLIRMDVVESTRGCPFQCTFCFNRSKSPRYRSPKSVVDEIEDSHNKYNTNFFMFLDDTLTIKKEHVMSICDEIIIRGLNKKIVFYANTRPNTIDKETLEKMRNAGLTEISTGVESGNPIILKNIKKGVTLEQYKKVYEWMKELGLQTRASFIVGFPFETHDTVKDTIEFAKKIDLMRASCNILTPYPGTLIYKQALIGDGIHLLTQDWKEFKRWGTSVIETNELTKEDLEYYQKRFLTEFYTQKKVLLYHLKQFLRGNFSIFYYRPVFYAIRNKLTGFLNESNRPQNKK